MDKNNRKLTKKEWERKEHFENLCFAMQQKGYCIKYMMIDIRQANYLGPLAMLPFIALAFWAYRHANGFDFERVSSGFAAAAFLLLLCLFLLHELIHGLVWGIFAKNHFRSIDFGIIWSSLSPYCTCSEPLRRWQYLAGVAMPTLVLGGGAAALAVAANHLLLFFLAELMILAGGGDFLIALKMLLYRAEKKELLYCDHPYECGFVIFEK